MWCISENSAITREQLAGAGRGTFHHRGIPDFEKASDVTRLIVLENLLCEAYSRDACDLFTKGIHDTISFILSKENVFHQGRFSRDISLNAKYLIVLKNVHVKNQFASLANQVYPENSNRLYESNLDAIRPHGYLQLDRVQDMDECLRFR